MSGILDGLNLGAAAAAAPKTPNNTLYITANNQTLTGWQSIRVTRGCERCPADFDISFTEHDPYSPAEIIIKPGDACTVKLGTDLVLTGYVDRYMATFRPGSHTVRVIGRSKSADTVDCSASYFQDGSTRGMGITSTSLVDLANQLTEPFGISVKSLTGNDVPLSGQAGLPVQFQIVLSETPFEVIERVARYAGVMVYDDPDGNLLLATAGAAKMASGFDSKVNIQEASVSFSMEDRYSVYVPSIMSVNSLSDQGRAAITLPVTQDQGVPRFRPIFVISEQSRLDVPLAVLRAQWERNRRYGRSQAVRLMCDSWRDSAGKLWEPNATVAVNIPQFKIKNAVWVIAEVNFLSEQVRGTTAELTLMPKQAFLVAPDVLHAFNWQVGQDLQQGGAAQGVGDHGQ